MLKNEICIAGIGQAVLELLSFKVGSGNQEIFGNLRKYEALFTENHVTSGKSQFPKIKN